MVRRIGSCQGRFSAGLSKLARFTAIAVVVNQELNIIPLRQGKYRWRYAGVPGPPM
ncbi:hypothetical protein F2981_00350 [Sinorhizobium meliloti]|nr:hypothetical protein [Sinorhizobium meliloti]